MLLLYWCFVGHPMIRVRVSLGNNDGSIPYAANGIFVRLESAYIVHVRLPVLDVALMVTGHHPVVVVRPHHRSDRTVVRLVEMFGFWLVEGRKHTANGQTYSNYTIITSLYNTIFTQHSTTYNLKSNRNSPAKLFRN